MLARQTTLPAGDGAAGVSVLFNMTKVWESYAQSWLQKQLPPGHLLAAQHPILLTDDDSQMTARADLVRLDEHGRPSAVYDAKYKPWGNTPSTSDLYQAVAYAYRLGLNRAFLLYPGRGERREISVGRYRIVMIGIEVLRPAPTVSVPAGLHTDGARSAGNS